MLIFEADALFERTSLPPDIFDVSVSRHAIGSLNNASSLFGYSGSPVDSCFVSRDSARKEGSMAATVSVQNTGI